MAPNGQSITQTEKLRNILCNEMTELYHASYGRIMLGVTTKAPSKTP